MELTIAKSDWMTLLRAHARRHRPAAIGLGFALLGVLALFAQSLLRLATGSAGPGPGFALLGGVVAFAATALGALPALVLRGISNRSEDSLLGFAAGMMLAASAFSLLMPGLQAGEEIFRNQALGVGAVVFGGDPALREKLNGILHPMVIGRMQATQVKLLAAQEEIVGDADTELPDKVLFDQPVLRGFQDLLRRHDRPPRRQHHRGRGRHILEFVGDDVDVVGEQLQRLDIGIFRTGGVQHDVEGRRIRVGRKNLAAQPESRRRHRQHPAQLSAAENSDGVAGLQLHLM